MNTFRIILFWLFSSLPVQAMPGKPEIRELALAGDVEAVEFAFRDGLNAALEQGTSQNDLRDAMTVFSVTDPRMKTFVDAWTARFPDSSFALSASAWQHYVTGWNIRGDRSLATTFPPAVSMFNEMHEKAMDLALAAHEISPDLIPASDAVMRLQMTTDRLGASAWRQFVDETLERNGNIGSLRRAADAHNPNWGGGGLPAIYDLCERHAKRITDVDDFSVEVCFSYLVNTHAYSAAEKAAALEPVRDLGHPILAYYVDRLDWPQQFQAREPFIHAYLESAGTESFWQAVAYIRDYKHLGADISGAVAIVEQAKAEAEAALQYDPYNDELINKVVERVYPDDDLSNDMRPDADRLTRLYENRLRGAPFNPRYWLEAADHHFLNGPLEDIALQDAFAINAIVFSNHDAGRIRWFLDMKFTQLHLYADARAFEAETGQAIIPVDYEGFDAEIRCPALRARRLLIFVCNQRPGGGACNIPDSYDETLFEMMDMQTAQTACWTDITTPTDGLLFTPVSVPGLWEF